MMIELCDSIFEDVVISDNDFITDADMPRLMVSPFRKEDVKRVLELNGIRKHTVIPFLALEVFGGQCE